MNQTLKDYAIWQAISDLEMYCRSRRFYFFTRFGRVDYKMSILFFVLGVLFLLSDVGIDDDDE